MAHSRSAATLWYRYWFYGWLFVDAQRGSVYERAAALRHNQACSHWLPCYMRRWATLGAAGGVLGWVLELWAPALVAMACFLVCVLSVPINAVTLAAWLGLRWGGSPGVRGGGR